jgi:hypothetical protein
LTPLAFVTTLGVGAGGGGICDKDFTAGDCGSAPTGILGLGSGIPLIFVGLLNTPPLADCLIASCAPDNIAFFNLSIAGDILVAAILGALGALTCG